MQRDAPETLEVQLQGERVLLHPQRALVWPARATLIIADPHFGKDDIFRRAGIALPRGPAITDLQRLTALIGQWRSTRLVILGDFVHGRTRCGDSFRHAFRIWRDAHPNLALDVILGNHDRREPAAGWTPFAAWHPEPLSEPPFVFAHEPQRSAAGYVLAGHVHPTLRLRRRSGGGRVPVFWRQAHGMVLPSFGSFTGGAQVNPSPGDVLYAAAPDRVVPLSAVPAR